VRRIETSSKNAVWDGKDNEGNIVPVGVYLVIASSIVSKSSGAAKIAVIE
jgi:flagellar hook assembly protein FlgD